MSLKDLQDYLNNSRESNRAVDVSAMKKSWLKAIDMLYSNVDQWLKPLNNNPSFQIKVEKKAMYESEIGNYETKQMIIKIGEKQARLIPVGMIIVGTRGRVDLVGPHGTIKLVLADKDATEPTFQTNDYIESEYIKEITPQPAAQKSEAEYEWKLITPPPDVRFLSLNEDRFTNALLQVIKNG